MSGGAVTGPLHRRPRIVCAFVAAVMVLVLVLPSVRAESFSDTGGEDFLRGTMLDTWVTPNGLLELTPGPGKWSKMGIALDVGPPGSPDSVWARDPAMLREGDSSYSMWYCAYDGTRNAIMFATSPDGDTWTKHGVVLSTPDTVCTPSVLKEGTMYHMWFQAGASGGNAIASTTSPDGVNWSAPSVALKPGAAGRWDSFAVGHPFVVPDGKGAYRMYYVGTEGTRDQIGLAISSNAASFVRASASPVLSFGNANAWDGYKVRIGSVLPPSPSNGFLWTMFYGGLDGVVWRLGFAFSRDGLSWTRSTRNPFLQNSVGFDSAALESAAFMRTANEIRLYYTASDGSKIRIGLAVKKGPELTFVASGTFKSRIFDSGNESTWGQAAWKVTFPIGSASALWFRVGDSSLPGTSWSVWTKMLEKASTANVPGTPRGRFMQYRIDMTAPSGTASPEISSVALSYGPYVTESHVVFLIGPLVFLIWGVVATSFAVIAYFLLKRPPPQRPIG